jgi:hypothetical protein
MAEYLTTEAAYGIQGAQSCARSVEFWVWRYRHE